MLFVTEPFYLLNRANIQTAAKVCLTACHYASVLCCLPLTCRCGSVEDSWRSSLAPSLVMFSAQRAPTPSPRVRKWLLATKYDWLRCGWTTTKRFFTVVTSKLRRWQKMYVLLLICVRILWYKWSIKFTDFALLCLAVFCKWFLRPLRVHPQYLAFSISLLFSLHVFCRNEARSSEWREIDLLLGAESCEATEEKGPEGNQLW